MRALITRPSMEKHRFPAGLLLLAEHCGPARATRMNFRLFPRHQSKRARRAAGSISQPSNFWSERASLFRDAPVGKKCGRQLRAINRARLRSGRAVFFILMTGRRTRRTVTAIMTHRHAAVVTRDTRLTTVIIFLISFALREPLASSPRRRSLKLAACQSVNCHACTLDRRIDYRLIRFQLT